MSDADSKKNEWRPNPYAKRFSAADRHLLTVRALAVTLGPELAVLAPDVAKVFPNSDAVNAALRAVIAAAETVQKLQRKGRTRTA